MPHQDDVSRETTTSLSQILVKAVFRLCISVRISRWHVTWKNHSLICYSVTRVCKCGLKMKGHIEKFLKTEFEKFLETGQMSWKVLELDFFLIYIPCKNWSVLNKISKQRCGYLDEKKHSGAFVTVWWQLLFKYKNHIIKVLLCTIFIANVGP